jgi:hypothetical protein
MPLVSKSFSDIITFTRASSGTYFDATGTLQTATTNAARFDYNPSTLAARGMLVEEQRTNSIRNNTMVGAVAGTPGTAPTNWTLLGSASGLTQQIIGTGTENGINYIDVQYSGTTTGAISSATIARYEAATQIAAQSGQTWTASDYIRIVDGSLQNISFFGIAVIERSAAGGFLDSTVVEIAPTAASLATQRRSVTRVLNNASTAFVTSQLLFSAPSGVAINITLRIGLPQLELGAFATSVISTTTAAATRSADVASVNTLSPWYNASAGTLYAEMQMLAAPLVNVGVPFSLTAASSQIALRMRPSQKAGASVIDSSVTVVDTSSVGNYTTGISKLSFGYASNDFASSLNGESPIIDLLGSVPVLTNCNIGNLSGSAFLNGYLRRITYYPRRLSNTELQGITT